MDDTASQWRRQSKCVQVIFKKVTTRRDKAKAVREFVMTGTVKNNDNSIDVGVVEYFINLFLIFIIYFFLFSCFDVVYIQTTITKLFVFFSNEVGEKETVNVTDVDRHFF